MASIDTGSIAMGASAESVDPQVKILETMESCGFKTINEEITFGDKVGKGGCLVLG